MTNNNASSDANTTYVSLETLLAFFVRNSVKVFICCVLFVALAFGLDHFLAGDKYEKELAKWETKFEIANKSLEVLKKELKEVQSYNENSPLMQIDPSSAVKRISRFKVSVSKEEYIVLPNGSIVLSSEQEAAKLATEYKHLDFNTILNSSIKMDYLNELISIKNESNIIEVTILSNSFSVAEEWGEILENSILKNGDIELLYTTTQSSFDNDLLTAQIESQTKENTLLSSVNEKEIELESILETRPVRVHVLRYTAIGIISGLIVAFLLFSCLPAFSGVLPSSKKLSLFYGVPCIGTILSGRKHILSGKIIGELTFNSQVEEDSYIYSGIKVYANDSKSILFISTKSIPNKERLQAIAEKNNMKTVFIENALSNDALFKEISKNQMVINIEKSFSCRLNDIYNLRSLLSFSGKKVDAIICLI